MSELRSNFMRAAMRGAWGRRGAWARRALVGLAPVLAIGCGKDGHVPVFPVKGQVTFKGENPSGAFIIFHPADGASVENKPSASVKGDGSFRLTTFENEDGAPAGEYAVTVEWNKLVVRGRDALAGPNVIPKKYSKPETTPWKVKVGPSPTELPPLEIAK